VNPAPEGEPRKQNVLLEWIKSGAIALVLFLVIRTFVMQAFTIPSGSMEGTLLVGDYLMANNAIFGTQIPFTPVHTPAFREPRHGDVVVFRPTYNQPVIDVVKRVIGEPGDTIQMIDQKVYRNGTMVDEPNVRPNEFPDETIARTGRDVLGLPPEIDPSRYGYYWHLDALPDKLDRESYRPTRDNWGPLIVPEGHYLLLGDNRDQSLDSRYMGFIPREQIRGKASFIYFSTDPLMDRPFPHFVTAARWGRLGTMVR
jgi:signal peptidase I